MKKNLVGCVFYKILEAKQQIDLSSPKIIYYKAYCAAAIDKKVPWESLEIKGGVFSLACTTARMIINPEFYDLETSFLKIRKLEKALLTRRIRFPKSVNH